MKDQKGITLIALVITIIVLLILAGVSIAMLTGGNGILSKASGAGVKSRVAEVDEAIRLGLGEILANKLDPTYSASDADGVTDEISATNLLAAMKKNNANIDKYKVTAIDGTSGDEGKIIVTYSKALADKQDAVWKINAKSGQMEVRPTILDQSTSEEASDSSSESV